MGLKNILADLKEISREAPAAMAMVAEVSAAASQVNKEALESAKNIQKLRADPASVLTPAQAFDALNSGRPRDRVAPPGGFPGAGKRRTPGRNTDRPGTTDSVGFGGIPGGGGQGGGGDSGGSLNDLWDRLVDDGKKYGILVDGDGNPIAISNQGGSSTSGQGGGGASGGARAVYLVDPQGNPVSNPVNQGVRTTSDDVGSGVRRMGDVVEDGVRRMSDAFNNGVRTMEEGGGSGERFVNTGRFGPAVHLAGGQSVNVTPPSAPTIGERRIEDAITAGFTQLRSTFDSLGDGGAMRRARGEIL